MTDVNFKLTKPNAIAPTRGSQYAAGLDLYACTEGACVIPEGATVKIGTGVAMEIPQNCFGGVFARSGFATKRGLRPANCVGVVDADYRGEIIVALYNDSDHEQIIHHGDRIAQLVIMPFLPVNLVQKDELIETERGDGGFGSTGTGIKP